MPPFLDIELCQRRVVSVKSIILKKYPGMKQTIEISLAFTRNVNFIFDQKIMKEIWKKVSIDRAIRARVELEVDRAKYRIVWKTCEKSHLGTRVLWFS